MYSLREKLIVQCIKKSLKQQNYFALNNTYISVTSGIKVNTGLSERGLKNIQLCCVQRAVCSVTWQSGGFVI